MANSIPKAYIMGMEVAIEIIASIIRSSVPLILVAYCGVLSERAGVINLALEGKLLVAAFFAAALTFWSGNPWIGAFAAVLSAVCMGCLYGLFVVLQRGDQVVMGMAFNLFALGVTPFLSKIFFNDTGGTPLMSGDQLPGVSILCFGLLCILFVSYVFKCTYFGLSLQIAGEKSEILRSVGISVAKTRMRAIVLGSSLIGVAGAILSLYLSSGFIRDMSAGRGFMAIAALIFGKWRPGLTVIACVFFGSLDVLQLHLQGISLGNVEVPIQIVQALPYALTLIIVAGFLGRSRAPSELGL